MPPVRARHDRIVVDITGTYVGRDAPGHLVRVWTQGQARPEVDELGDALPGYMLYRARQELAIRPSDIGNLGESAHDTSATVRSAS